MLVDVFQKGILGSEAELALGKAGITVNKNTIPYDVNPPMKASGIRIGTPAMTTRGMKEPEMVVIGAWIAKALEQRNDDAALEQIRHEVAELANRFPLYAWRRAPRT
jgi:glycine hydroxymethyltransferase